MLNFVFRRKRDPIPPAYRGLAQKETSQVAGGIGLQSLGPGGGQGCSKDPNG